MNVALSTPLVSKRVSAIVNEATEEILFWDGFASYCEKQPLEDMPTPAQQQGWWSANSAEAYANMPPPPPMTPHEALEATVEYVDWQEDIEWIRRGC